MVRRSSSSDRVPEGGSGAVVNEQVEYAHGTEKQEVTRATGRVERISVAIAVHQPLTDIEQQRLQRLVMAAIGGDAGRGDVVEIGVASAGPTSQPAGQSSSITGHPDHPAVRTTSAVGAWQAGSLVWLLAAAAISLIVGLLIGKAVTQSRRKKLSREQSEQAAQQIKAWLLGPAHERL
nr:flagellar M-ring protein FliF C-terminal domain-containing protein [Xanthomonas cannabis]